MWGLSYLGNVQWLAAEQRPPALRAIAPRFTWREPEHGFLSRGGALEHGVQTWWSLFTGLDVVTRRHAGDEAATMERLGSMITDLDDLGRIYAELPSGRAPVYARHGLPSPSPTTIPSVSQGDDAVPFVPSLNIAGWFDVFVQGTINNYLANTSNAQLLIGPWSHVSTLSRQGDVDFGYRANDYALDLSDTLTGLTLEWLWQHLTDTSDTAVASESPDVVNRSGVSGAPVRIFVMGRNEWRDEAEWPLKRAVDTRFFLTADGGLTPHRPADLTTATYRYDLENPVSTCGGAVYLPDHPSGMIDQAVVEARDDVLVFTSEPLASDLEVTGPVSAVITATTDGPTTDWVVRLCEVDANGVSRNVTDGILRSVGPADVAQTVTVDLWSTSMVFRAGHRLRVQVTSSNFPRWDRNLNSTVPAQEATTPRVAMQAIQLGGEHASWLTVPIVPQIKPVMLKESR
jgi:putative CocE/NonD family hydrolase